MESMSGTRFSHAEPAVPGQRITYELKPPRASSSYYTKVVISDSTVQDLQLRMGNTGMIIALPRTLQEVEFPDHLRVRAGVISFTVTEVTSFGKAVINVHMHSTSPYNHYL